MFQVDSPVGIYRDYLENFLHISLNAELSDPFPTATSVFLPVLLLLLQSPDSQISLQLLLLSLSTPLGNSLGQDVR